MAVSKEEIRADEEELAKNLASALAHIWGLKSIDRERKHYVEGKTLSEEWIALAQHALYIHKTLGIPAKTSRKQ